MALDAESEAEASEKVETACKKLLANPIMKTYASEYLSRSFFCHPAGMCSAMMATMTAIMTEHIPAG